MEKYHKIESIFERDMEGTKKLIEGKYRNPLVEYLKDNQWTFTEKVDGTNVRVHWDGHNVIFGGRTDAAQLPSHLVNVLNEKFAGTVNEQVFEQKFGETPITLYGEGFGEKIQKDGGLYGEVNFALFDVSVDGVFLERENVKEIADSFGIEIVPVAFEGTIEEAVEHIKGKPFSLIAEQEKEMEGIVGVPNQRVYDVKGNRIIVKIKSEDFNH